MKKGLQKNWKNISVSSKSMRKYHCCDQDVCVYGEVLCLRAMGFKSFLSENTKFSVLIAQESCYIVNISAYLAIGGKKETILIWSLQHCSRME